ncbi:MAG: hypothetical protein KA419_02345 [Acidobacteria bacterium]|nr:hypothetical protein [Acidobacteriota bacterium]
MAIARKNIVADGAERVYHCTARCVRRAFLCGDDPDTGKNFDHRKDWVRDRLVQLAGYFAVDVLAYAVMDNHLHDILRTRPDRAEAMTDEEVARNWVLSSPSRKTPPDEETLRVQVKRIVKKASRVRQLRKRLAKLSWFMGRLNEYIARKANAEDGCKGRFWEGRYQCRLLEGEGALLTCMAYVELNPVRAGLSRTPEESVHTSAWERLDALAAETRLAMALRVAEMARLPGAAGASADVLAMIAKATGAPADLLTTLAKAAGASAEETAAITEGAGISPEEPAATAETARNPLGVLTATVEPSGVLSEMPLAEPPEAPAASGIPPVELAEAAQAPAAAGIPAEMQTAESAEAPGTSGIPPELLAAAEAAGIPPEVLAAAVAEAARAQVRASWLAPLNGAGGRKGVFATLTAAEYFRVLDAVGRVVRPDKAGAIPAELAPILERLSLDAAEWLASVRGYERRFRRVVGCAGRLAELARAAGLKWFQGVAACRKLFLPARTQTSLETMW